MRESRSDIIPSSSLGDRPAETMAADTQNPARNTPYAAGISRHSTNVGILHEPVGILGCSMFIDSHVTASEMDYLRGEVSHRCRKSKPEREQRV